MKRREFISLFAGVAAAWALEAFGQESATMPETNATKSTLPQIEIVRVRPVDGPPVNLRLRDGPDLMKDFRVPGRRHPISRVTALSTSATGNGNEAPRVHHAARGRGDLAGC